MVFAGICGRASGLAAPLRVPAFRRLWLAQIVSDLGDWAARLALAVLVYTRTGSPALTGVVTAASLLPRLGLGQLLTVLGERWPRRRVLVTADLVRAGAFALAALPLPLPLLVGIVFCAGLATPPFDAARSAIRPEIVPAPIFGASVALFSMTEDLAVALGYLAGGGLVASLGASTALLVNAASFAASAILLCRLPVAPAARTAGADGGLRRAIAAVRADPVVTRAVILVTGALLSGTALIAMAVPLMLHSIGGGPGASGLLAGLTALISLGATSAIPVQSPPSRLLRIAGAMSAVGGGLVAASFALALIVPALRGLLATTAFAAAGLLLAVLAPANVVVGPRLPAGVRAAAFSMLMGMLVTTEAAGAVGAGLLAAGIGVVPACMAVGVPARAVGLLALMPARMAAVDTARVSAGLQS
jgi:hypothetical protein